MGGMEKAVLRKRGGRGGDAYPAAAAEAEAGAGEDTRKERAVELLRRSEAAAREKSGNERWVDMCMLVVLTVLGFFSRFYLLSHPPEVVFDEQHFGKFVNWYIRGEYFLDIHPPLGKLLIMLAGLVTGYEAQLGFNHPGEPYLDDSFLVLRFLPAFFGALLVPLVYVTVRVMRVSPGLAGLAAWMVLCENAILTESRAILCDSFLFFFDVCAVLCSFQANKKKPLSFAWAFWMALCGISMGLCVSVKLTALGIVGAVGVHQVMVLFKSYERSYSTIVKDFISRGCLLLGPFLLIFLALFVVHVLLLPYYGDGDDFMTYEYLARLVAPDGSKKAQFANVRPLSLFSGIKELITTMHAVNIGLKATHPFQSYWYEWPLIQCKTVLFWHRLRAGYGMYIYCVGNPATWISSTLLGVVGFGVVAALGAGMRFSMAFSSEQEWKRFSGKFWRVCNEAVERYWWTAFMLWVGYMANFLPFSLVPRATWNYHYLPSLLFAIMLTAVVLQILLDICERLDRNTYVLVKALLLSLVVAITGYFLYLAPWTYALPLSDQENQARFLFDSWKLN